MEVSNAKSNALSPRFHINGLSGFTEFGAHLIYATVSPAQSSFTSGMKFGQLFTCGSRLEGIVEAAIHQAR
jgi:hypothetical protein